MPSTKGLLDILLKSFENLMSTQTLNTGIY